MALALGAVLVPTLDAAPAGADTRIEVEAGYAGGYFVPGRPVVVRVSVSSDRLLRGDLQVEQDLSGESPPIVVPIEVAGGSAKEVVVAVPTMPTFDRLKVTASLDGTRKSAEARYADDVELIGLLPGVAEDAPGQLPVPMDLGTARFAQLDEATLAAPGALDALGTIVSGVDGLAGLDGRASANLITWLDQGGHLVVDSPAGTEVEGLPDAWQLVDSTRVAAGRGEVRSVSGAVARGSWADVVEPTSAPVNTNEMSRMGFATEEVSTTLARDSGLELPPNTWLIGFLVVYVLLVGPAAYVLVRRRRRANVAWLGIGAVAVVFTAAAFVGGRDIRSGTQAAHASFVETGAGGSRAYSYLGLVSPSGTDPEVGLPGDWAASGYFSMWSDPGMADGFTSSPSRVELLGDRVETRLGLEAGGYGVMSTWGPLDGVTGIEVTATAAADGTVRGTVRNTTDAPLDEVLLMVGTRASGIGELAPGQTTEWELLPGKGEPSDPWSPPETPWDRFTGWNELPDEDSPVDYPLWVQRRIGEIDPYATGWVTAAGWTRSWRPPVQAGETLAGSTVFTSRVPVVAEEGALPFDTVRRELVRTDFGGGNDQFGPMATVVARFVLPGNADPATPLDALVSQSVQTLEVWDGGRWAELDGDGCGGAEQPPMDPSGDPTTCTLPAAAVDGGVLHLRVTLFDDSSTIWPGISVQGARA